MANVVASRAKLEKALVKSGLGSRQCLAEEIAAREGKENAPLTMVNNAFSEKPIRSTSLLRIANALGVSDSSLLKDAPGQGDSEDKPPTDAKRALARGSQYLGWFAACAIAVAVLISKGQSDVELHDSSEISSPPALDVIPTLGFAHATSDFADRATGLLQTALSEADWPVLPGAPRFRGDELSPGIDVLLQFSTEGSERHKALLLKAITVDETKLIWAGFFPTRTSDTLMSAQMTEAVESISKWYLDRKDVWVPSFEAREAYLRGRNALDQDRTEIQIRRALSAFQSALRYAPNWAYANSGLCLALVEEFIWSKATTKLQEAKTPCKQALEASPALLSAQIANGNLARKLGEIQRALEHLALALRIDPESVDALIFFAEAKINQHQTDAASGALAEAIEMASRAAQLAPDYWRAHYVLARTYYYTNDIRAALESTLASTEALPTHLGFNNQGVYYMCLGDYKAAAEAYRQARKVYPDSHIDDFQLATVAYFSGDFEESAELYKSSMDVVGEASGAEYRTISGYADSLRHLGRIDEATKQYRIALGLVEDMIGSGESNPIHRANRISFMAAMYSMNPSLGSDAALSSLSDELASLREVSTQDPDMQAVLASVYVLIGDKPGAREMTSQLKGSCSGYFGLPEISELLKLDG